MALPHTRTLGDQQRDPQHAGNHVQRTPNVKRQTRETSAAMSSNAVQGPKVMSRHSTPSTDSSTQRRHRSLHLRSKRHDSAVHDTLNEGRCTARHEAERVPTRRGIVVMVLGQQASEVGFTRSAHRVSNAPAFGRRYSRP
jgi:hypothetical protein